ncbi:hypothetical protein [Sorangium sp. So ce1000]|uniref:hypothetical protein n=1 Tax=Sorangium sp. So ce1000 TaxID=3133325 RepID=UPI003F5EC2BF
MKKNQFHPKPKNKNRGNAQESSSDTSRPLHRSVGRVGRAAAITNSSTFSPSHSVTSSTGERRGPPGVQPPPVVERFQRPAGTLIERTALDDAATRGYYRNELPPMPPRNFDRSDRVARSMNIDTVRTLGRYVDQNAPAHLGRDLMYTMNLSTCTALAMYSPTTGEALLLHADATSDPALFAQDIWDYANTIRFQLNNRSFADSGSQIVLFCTDDRESSLAIVETALRQAFADEPEALRTVLYQISTRFYDVGRNSHITVGDGNPPMIVLPDREFKDYMITRYQKSDADVEATRTELLALFARGGSVEQIDRSVRFDIVDRAIKLGHRDIVELFDPDGAIRAFLRE